MDLSGSENKEAKKIKPKRKRTPKAILIQEWEQAPSGAKPLCNLYGTCKRERLSDRKRCAEHEQQSREYQDKWKKLVVEHYGSRCNCCGEPKWEFLEVDHADNNGAEHRNANRGRKGWQICMDLVKAKFPTEIKIQMLCANCNKIKEYRRKCLHQQYRDIYNASKLSLLSEGLLPDEIERKLEQKAEESGWRDTHWLLRERGMLTEEESANMSVKAPECISKDRMEITHQCKFCGVTFGEAYYNFHITKRCPKSPLNPDNQECSYCKQIIRRSQYSNHLEKICEVIVSNKVNELRPRLKTGACYQCGKLVIPGSSVCYSCGDK